MYILLIHIWYSKSTSDMDKMYNHCSSKSAMKEEHMKYTSKSPICENDNPNKELIQ